MGSRIIPRLLSAPCGEIEDHGIGLSGGESDLGDRGCPRNVALGKRVLDLGTPSATNGVVRRPLWLLDSV
jgi:hypothetical protein